MVTGRVEIEIEIWTAVGSESQVHPHPPHQMAGSGLSEECQIIVSHSSLMIMTATAPGGTVQSVETSELQMTMGEVADQDNGRS